MFAIFLRGGGTTGAIYHLYSDQSLTANIYNYGWDSSINKYRANVLPAPQISYRTDYIQYKSDLCFGNPGNKTQNPAGSGYYDDLQYKVDAPEPRTMVANGTTEGGFTKYLRTSSQEEEIRVRNYVKLTQDSDKKLVNSTIIEYYLSTSNSTLTGGSWTATLPAKVSNTYLWTRQKIVYKDGSSITGTAICLDNKSGSRNLLIGTATATGDVASGTGTLVDNLDLFDGLSGVKTNTAYQERYVNLKNVYERNGFRVGDVLTLSVYVKSDSATTKSFGLFRASSNSQNDSTKTVNLTSNWQQIYFTFIASDYSKTVTTTRIECSSASDTNYIYWAGWKLEKGNIASDWTQAPEDIEAEMEDLIISTENQFCIGESSVTPPAEDNTGWTTGLIISNINTNEYLWSRIKNTTKSGNVFYSEYSCLVYAQKELINQETEYILSKDDQIQPANNATYIDNQSATKTWSTSKPTENVNAYPYLWSRLHSTFKYTGATVESVVETYQDYSVDTSWNQLFSLTNELQKSIASILEDIMGGYVHIEGGSILIGDDEDNPTKLIIMNHNGIAFFDNPDGVWPGAEKIESATSTWNIDGTLNMENINVINLTATDIENQNLVLGNNNENGASVTGDLDIYDRQGHIMFETVLDTNKNYIEGFKIYKYNISGTTVTPNGYIYLSRENGFREYAAGGNNLIFGNNGNEQFASITNQTTQQVITNQLPKEAKGDTHFGIQIVPMTVNNTGDGKTHTGIAFLKY